MRETFTDFYADLGIELKGRKPSEVTAEEIENAYKEKKADFDKVQQAYRKQARELHPDSVPASEAAIGLSPEEIRSLQRRNEEKLKPINAKWQQDNDAYKKAKTAFDALKDPEKRKKHDEAHINRGAGNHNRTGAGASSDDFWRRHYQSTHNENQQFKEALKAHIQRARTAGVVPDLSSYTLSFRDLSGMDFEGCSFGNPLFGTKFQGANLKNADFSKLSTLGCVFDEKTQLDGANFSRVIFGNVNLPRKLTNVNFTSASFYLEGIKNLSERTFENCIFDGAHFDGHDLKGSVFKDCSFQGAKFLHRAISNVRFEGGIFHTIGYANFENVTFKDIKSKTNHLDFSRAKLKNVTFEGSLKGFTLTEEQLRYVDLRKANTAELRVVDLSGNEVKNPFGRTASGGNAGAAKAADQEAGKAHVSSSGHGPGSGTNSSGARSAEGEAGKARSFVDRLLRTAEGEIHIGKVTGLATGVALAGGAIYYIVSDRKKDPTWKERISSGRSDFKEDHLRG